MEPKLDNRLLEFYDQTYSSFDKAYIRDPYHIRLENSRGFYDYVCLTPEMAFWLITREVEIIYE